MPVWFCDSLQPVELSVRMPMRASKLGVMCQVSSMKASAKSARQPSSVVAGA